MNDDVKELINRIEELERVRKEYNRLQLALVALDDQIVELKDDLDEFCEDAMSRLGFNEVPMKSMIRKNGVLYVIEFTMSSSTPKYAAYENVFEL